MVQGRMMKEQKHIYHFDVTENIPRKHYFHNADRQNSNLNEKYPGQLSGPKVLHDTRYKYIIFAILMLLIYLIK